MFKSTKDESHPSRRFIMIGSMILTIAGGATLIGSGVSLMAKDASPEASGDAPISARSQKKNKLTVALKRHAAVAAPTAQVPPAQAAGPLASPTLASALVKAGAGACADQVNTLGAATMGGVASFNTAAHWALSAPDRRPVSVFIGQKFVAAGVPYGASGVFAAPNGQGGCDGMSVQVVPSPLSCSKLRETLSSHGKQVGDLAGIPLMEDAGNQTMLVPTTANTCVLVGVRTAYAK